MRKSVPILALLLALSFTLAQGTNFSVSATQASVNQQINVAIPNRLALHVDTPVWNLDLSSTGNIPNNYCFAFTKTHAAAAETMWDTVGANAMAAVQGATSAQEALDALSAYMLSGWVPRATSYPVVDVNSDGQISGDSDKGYLICLFAKIVQKFANGDGWLFEASLNGAPDGGFGVFGMADLMGGTYQNGFITTAADGTAHELASGSGTTGGWLDDVVLEGFYFDGSEVAGTYNLTVNYTLTNP